MRRDNKEILLGYIATLPDQDCKEIYYLLQDIKAPKRETVEFGKVKLTQAQYSKLIWLWGKEKTDICIKILDEWMVRKNVTKPISCYRSLVGWVENAYYRTHPADDKSLKFNSKIDTAWKARSYIKRLPPELRAYDSEVKFLVEKFGTKILEDI